MIALHAERVAGEPAAVRWVVPPGSLPPGRIRTAPGELGMLFDDGTLSLAQAAKLAGLGVEDFIERVGAAGLAVVRTPPEELDSELEVIARHGRNR